MLSFSLIGTRVSVLWLKMRDVRNEVDEEGEKTKKLK